MPGFFLAGREYLHWLVSAFVSWRPQPLSHTASTAMVFIVGYHIIARSLGPLGDRDLNHRAGCPDALNHCAALYITNASTLEMFRQVHSSGIQVIR
jgi:hypothetical protein